MSDKAKASDVGETAPDPAATTRRVKVRRAATKTTTKSTKSAAARGDRRSPKEPVEHMRLAVGPNPEGHNHMAMAAQQRDESKEG